MKFRAWKILHNQSAELSNGIVSTNLRGTIFCDMDRKLTTLNLPVGAAQRTGAVEGLVTSGDSNGLRVANGNSAQPHSLSMQEWSQSTKLCDASAESNWIAEPFESALNRPWTAKPKTGTDMFYQVASGMLLGLDCLQGQKVRYLGPTRRPVDGIHQSIILLVLGILGLESYLG